MQCRQRSERLAPKTAWCRSLGHPSFQGRVFKLRPRVTTWFTRSVARPLRRSSRTLQRLSQRPRTTENCWLTEATRAKKFHTWWIESLFQAWNDRQTSFNGCPPCFCVVWSQIPHRDCTEGFVTVATERSVGVPFWDLDSRWILTKLDPKPKFSSLAKLLATCTVPCLAARNKSGERRKTCVLFQLVTWLPFLPSSVLIET